MKLFFLAGIIPLLLLIPLVSAASAPTPTVKTELNTALTTNFALLGNTTLYLNSTDGHYHMKGTIKNIGHTSISNVLTAITFEDKVTQVTARDVYGPIIDNVDPGQTAHFDIDTKYTANQANQFQYLVASVRAH
jgi:hypothetical protein